MPRTSVTFWTLLTLITLCAAMDTISLRGIGATFPRVVYHRFLGTFTYERSYFVTLEEEYVAEGSYPGKESMLAPVESSNYDYGATDAVLTDDEHDRNPDVQMIPVVAGAVVMCYRIPGISSLNLTRANLVGIYNGSITHWDDPLIQSVNPEIILPSEEIYVIARGDYSGTTEIFTAALSAFSSEWAGTYGTFAEGTAGDNRTPIHWEDGVVNSFGKQDIGMMGMLFTFNYSIGYLSISDALTADFSYARIFNRAGKLSDVTDDGYRDAMLATASQIDSDRLTANLVDQPFPNSYPITGYSYFLIRKHEMSDCGVAMELLRYISWLQTNDYAEIEAEEMKMRQVIPEIADMVQEHVLSHVTCDGERVWPLVERRMADEIRSLQNWRLPVFITTPVIIAIILALICYLGYQQVKLRRISLSDEWYIPYIDMYVLWNRSQGWVGGSRSNFGSTTTTMTSRTDVSTMGFTNPGNNDILAKWKEMKVGLK